MKLRFKITPGGATKPKLKRLEMEPTPKKKAQDAWIKTQKDKKRVQLSTWVPEKHKAGLVQFISLLRDGKQPSEAFSKSFLNLR